MAWTKLTFAEVVTRYGQTPLRSRIGGVVALLVLIVGAYVLFWQQGQQSELSAMQESLRKTESERSEKIAYAANLALYEARLSELSARLQDARAMLPDSPDVPQFLSQIGAIAKETGLVIERFEPGHEEAQDFYSETKFTLQVRGTYHEIGLFLDAVSRMDRIVNVGGLSMVDPKALDQQVLVTGAFYLRAFRSLTAGEMEQAKKDRAATGDAGKARP